MRPRSALVAATLSLLSLLFAACQPPAPKHATVAVTQLASPDPVVRRNAAEALAEEGGPDEAIRPLYAALRKEQNPATLGAMLVALGATGIAEARPFIDARVNDPDGEMARCARRALKKWLVRNMLLSDEDELPAPPCRLYGQLPVPPGAPGGKPIDGLDGGT